MLLATALTYAEHFKKPAAYKDEIPHGKISPKELELAKTLMDAIKVKDFDFSQYKDPYRDRVMELVESKVKGEAIEVPEEEEEPAAINFMEALKKSIEKAPSHNSGAYFELGKILYQSGEFEASETALLKAVEQDQNNPEYLSKLGAVALARGEVDEAIGHLQRAQTAATAFPEIYFALGRAYQRKGNRVRAGEYFNRFEQATTAQRQSEEKNQVVDRNITRGELKLDEGNVTEARSFFEQAAVADPDRWEPHGYLAEMFLDSGELDRAYPHLTKMEAIDPDSVVGNYLMARYSFARKDFERARTYAERVEKSRPGNSELRGLLGRVYEALGKTQDALREYEIAVRLAPGRADFQDALRRIRSQEAQGKPAVAKP